MVVVVVVVVGGLERARRTLVAAPLKAFSRVRSCRRRQ